MAEGKKELEDKIVEVGRRLASPPSDAGELFAILDEMESLLSRVDQLPSQSMSAALYPVMKALVDMELLEHANMGVKVAVASCISEITRITAPDASYSDDLMKEILQIIVGVFKELDDTSSNLYGKRVSILEIVSNVRLCVMMLDLDCDSLILEMFNHFLNTKRSDHPEIVSSSMEAIMTLVIGESDDISSELLSCLLASVKEDCKDRFPTAYKLGEKVIGNCSEKLKPYFVELIQSMGASFSDYSKIIVSMFQENCDNLEKNGNNVFDEYMVDGNLSERTISGKLPQESEKLESEVSSAEELSTSTDLTQKAVVSSADELSTSTDMTQKAVVSNEIVTIGNDLSMAVKSDCMFDHATKKLKGRKCKSLVQPTLTDNPDGTRIRSEMVRRERSRKVHSKSTDCSYFDGPPREAHSAMSLGSDENTELQHPAGSDRHNLLNTVPRRRGRPVGSKTRRCGVSTTTKHVVSPPGERGSVILNQTKEEAKASKGSVPSNECDSINNLEGKRTRRSRNKFSVQLNAERELDETLVGLKIEVWWPDDKEFYEGVVCSFNPTTKKHKILYDDGDVEILRLRNERWKLIKAQVKDSPCTDASSEVPKKRKSTVSSDSVCKRANTEIPLESGDVSVGKSTADVTVSVGKKRRVALTSGGQFSLRSSRKSREKSASGHEKNVTGTSSEPEEEPEKSDD